MKSRMTTSIFWLVGIYLALTAGIAAQVASQEEMAPQTRVYVVKGGDTLWEISSRFLDGPWYWPQLWALNPYITNPHLIYPGEPIALGQAPQVQVAQAQVAQAQPPQVVEEVPAAAAPAPEEAAPAPEAAVLVPETVTLAPGTAAPAPEAAAVPAAAPIQPAAVETAAPEEYAPVEEELPPPVSGETIGIQETVYYAKVTSRGFISPNELGKMGLIVGSHEEKIMFSAGDVVFTNLGENSGVKVGDRFSILEQGNKVFHPQTKKLMGYQVEIMGDLEIMELNGQVSTAKIIHSENVVAKSNFLRAFEPAVKEIDLKQFSGQIDGFVVGAQNPVENSVEKDIIYLDRGTRDGLEVGNLMLVYRPSQSVLEPGTKKSLKLPPRLLGKVLIVDVKDGTSAALITSSLDTVRVGDCFRSGVY
ncbi:MAG: LysM domain-containing protein [Proteobacteria bacterium]|nr:LysM domain-containing protein [Pseudomonadota bacterium]